MKTSLLALFLLTSATATLAAEPSSIMDTCRVHVPSLLRAAPSQLGRAVDALPEATCRWVAPYLAAESLYGEGKYAEVQRFASEAMRNNPCEANIYFYLGGFHVFKDDYESAACYFQKGQLIARTQKNTALADEMQLAFVDASRKVGGIPSRQLACSVALGQTFRERCGAMRSGMDAAAEARLSGGEAPMRLEFDYNSATLSPQGREDFDKMLGAMRGDKVLKAVTRDLMAVADDAPAPAPAPDADTRRKVIRLVGHTDERGRADYNRDLSLRRAKAVQATLAKTFSRAKFLVEGRGATEPLVANAASEEDHARNRRVEVRFE